MTESIFSKIYSYREQKEKDSKENYLIEIFAYCLNTDIKLRENFLALLGLKDEEHIIIKTQTPYEFGRPDIEINIPSTKTCILIECKIEHYERPNQLSDYKKILENKDVLKRHLVYLTKYYDCRENHNKKIEFHPLKWLDIFNLIGNTNSILSQELKNFLKIEKYGRNKKFYLSRFSNT